MEAETRARLEELARRGETLGRHLDLPRLKIRIEELEQRTLVSGFWDNSEVAQKVLRDKTTLETLVSSVESVQRDIRDATELIELADLEDDTATINEVVLTLDPIAHRIRRLELEQMLNLPEDKLDCYIEVNAGAGGTDAQDWAQMVARMYLRWAEAHGYTTEVIDESEGEEAGIKSMTILVRGHNAFGFLAAERGVHRLIRISPFDSQARRQTAFAAVHVTPDIDDSIEVEIRREDYDRETMRSGGAGGQHVNKVESCIRITHRPSGIVIKCQSERSQHENERRAMKMLKAKLYELERLRREAEFAKIYESNKLSNAFSSQIRTYTMAPYRMVKDERTELKVSDVDRVINGDIDEFIESFLLQQMERRKQMETRDKLL
ncbi:MAG: peptide chain release factor 2 [Deltaproteobacteria bacterium]|nr:peptide chain release factor 2 [Deltaproteobacteria bacterium]